MLAPIPSGRYRPALSAARSSVPIDRASSRASAFSWRPIPASTIVIRARLRHLSRHLGVPQPIAAACAAGAAFEEPEAAEQRRLPAHSCRWLHPCGTTTPDTFAHRSRTSASAMRRIWQALDAARPARGAANDRNVSRRERHARRAAIPAQQLSARRSQSLSRLPVGIRV